MSGWKSLGPKDDLPEALPYLLLFDYGHGRSYKMFHHLSQVKLNITNRGTGYGGNDQINKDIHVYEWDGTGWQEIYFLAKGSSKGDHPLWKNGPAPKVRQVIAEADVNAAVASILGTNQPEEG